MGKSAAIGDLILDKKTNQAHHRDLAGLPPRVPDDQLTSDRQVGLLEDI